MGLRLRRVLCEIVYAQVKKTARRASSGIHVVERAKRGPKPYLKETKENEAVRSNFRRPTDRRAANENFRSERSDRGPTEDRPPRRKICAARWRCGAQRGGE